MRKHFNLLTILVISAIIGLTAAEVRSDYICGDANGDSDVNVSDAVYIINYVFVGGDPPDPLEIADCNCDTDVNVSDAVYIINYVFVGGNEPCDINPPSPNGDEIPDCDPNCPLTVVDIDGNVYQTIKIGGQCWMMENLKVIHYRNGDPIPNITGNADWENLTTGAHCNYENDEGNVAIYGRLYNGYAVDDSRNIAPEGWHVASDIEWKQLEMYLGMSQAEADGMEWRGTYEGGKLKEAGTTHWITPNTGATNESGFTALPGGYRAITGVFRYLGSNAYFWSSTMYGGFSAWNRALIYIDSRVYRYFIDRNNGYSVRCVKD